MDSRQKIFDGLIVFCIVWPIYDYYYNQEHPEECPYDLELWATGESVGLIVSIRISVFGIASH